MHRIRHRIIPVIDEICLNLHFNWLAIFSSTKILTENSSIAIHNCDSFELVCDHFDNVLLMQGICKEATALRIIHYQFNEIINDISLECAVNHF